ncbi:neprilysin-like [Chelonus insularis]|uniref:neprilysin-like n=1 Tax=Chelonus insularis TaxID=460826 RepID=UPI00158BA735|nr:neprilysin-like [Chelonus insularis]
MVTRNPSFFYQLTVFITFILIYKINHLQTKSIDVNDEPVCTSEVCKRIAQDIIQKMVQTNDPCADFYLYACGNVAAQTEKSYFNIIQNITAHRLKEILESTLSTKDNSALTKAKILYKTCIDEDTIEKEGVSGLSRLMDQYGGWPMTMTEFEWNFKKKPWQEVDSAFKKLSGFSPLFSLAVQVDLKNSSGHIIWLSPTSIAATETFFPIELTEVSTANDLFTKVPAVENYKNAIKNASKVIAKYRGSPLSENTLDEDAKNVILFEWQLKAIQLNKNSTNQKQDINDLYYKTSIVHFQRAYNLMFPQTENAKIDWLHLMKNHLADVPYIHLQESEIISVTSIEYFLQLSGLLDKTSSRVIVNTIHWWLVKALGRYTNKDMVTILDQMLSPSSNPRQPTPRWTDCVSANDMAHAVALAYVQKYFPPKAKDAAIDMIHEIIHEMEIKVDNSNWLDGYSKQGALKKLKFMKEFVGYPDWYENSGKIDEFYQDFKVSQSFLNNTLEATKFKLIKTLKLLREPVDKKQWVAIPTAVNAFYSYPGNSLIIPAGILQSPFFEEEQPDAINYGGIGTIIGHEVSHGFDNIGCQFDEEGNVRNWWTNATRTEYFSRAQCFIEKFSNYSIVYNSTAYRVNPFNTLSENIADSVGMHAVYEAFQVQKTKTLKAKMRLPGLENLSSNQLFFLSYAHTFCSRPRIDTLINQMRLDPHSPAAFRIVGTLSNMDKFAEAYKCPKGTRMNPIKKCSIW